MCRSAQVEDDARLDAALLDLLEALVFAGAHDGPENLYVIPDGLEDRQTDVVVGRQRHEDQRAPRRSDRKACSKAAAYPKTTNFGSARRPRDQAATPTRTSPTTLVTSATKT